MNHEEQSTHPLHGSNPAGRFSLRQQNAGREPGHTKNGGTLIQGIGAYAGSIVLAGDE